MTIETKGGLVKRERTAAEETESRKRFAAWTNAKDLRVRAETEAFAAKRRCPIDAKDKIIPDARYERAAAALAAAELAERAAREAFEALPNPYNLA